MPTRQRLQQTLTLYGRKTVLEALQDSQLSIDRLHLADSNRQGHDIRQLIALAEQRDVEICTHSRAELSRISRNGRQDQGVAADIFCARLHSFNSWWNDDQDVTRLRLIALDGVGNPQNLGMCIRSCLAAGIDAILLGGKGSTRLGPLTVKASAGTALRAPIVTCADLPAAVGQLRQAGAAIIGLRADAQVSLFDGKTSAGIYVLGNESAGLSQEVEALCTDFASIPMHGNVESLNVAVTTALVAFHLSVNTP